MEISSRQTTVGSPVELVCGRPEQAWRSVWTRDGQPVLTGTRARGNPCLVKWHIDTPAHSHVSCPTRSGRFILRFQQSTVELNDTTWNCKLDGTASSNNVTIKLTEETKGTSNILTVK